jgi:trimeric autotransporter adhesin
MSTKTTFKRIALATVAAMGFGLLSAAPSSAAVLAASAQTITVKVGGTTTTTGMLTTATATADNVTIEVAATGLLTAAIRLTSPSGAKVYAGSSFSDSAATVAGTVAVSSAVATFTLDADAFNSAGLWTVAALADSTGSTTPTTASTIDTAIAASSGSNSQSATVAVYGSAATYVGGAGRTVTTASNISQDVTGTITYFIVSDASSASYTVNASGMTILSAFGSNAGWTSSSALTAAGSGDVVTNNNGSSAAGGVTWTPGTAGKSFLQIKTTAAEAGTGTLTVTPLNSSGTPGLARTASATWAAAPVASAQYSTIYLNAGTTQADSTNDDTVAGVNCARTVGTQCANIAVQIKDQLDRALDLKGVSVTITGPGTLGLDGDNTTAAALTYTTSSTGRALSVTSLAGSFAAISVWPDGSAGTATITVSSGTTVLGSKKVTFFGAAAKISVVSQTYKVARASVAGGKLGDERTNTTDSTGYVAAVKLLVEDADGTDVAATVTCLPADLTVIASCTFGADDNATYGLGTGYYNVAVTSAVNGVSGKSTTVVFRTLVGTTFVVSEPVTFTLGGSITSTKATLDKASYSPGEAMVLTVAAFDSDGNKAYDGQAMAYSLSANKPVGGSLPAASLALRDGMRATSATAPTLFAPAVGGPFTITVTGNDTGLTKVTATADVAVDSSAIDAAADAAAEATDAANAATDAANAAAEAADAATAAAQDAADAVAALSTSVTAMVDSLRKQITSLTNLVIKIQRKVRA